jgi:hypothetical protein
VFLFSNPEKYDIIRVVLKIFRRLLSIMGKSPRGPGIPTKPGGPPLQAVSAAGSFFMRRD